MVEMGSESVLIQRIAKPRECRAGLIVDADDARGVIIRGTGKKGGEFVAQSGLLETGVAENNRGTLRFYKIPMTPQAIELFKEITAGIAEVDTVDSGLEPIESSRLVPNTVLRLSTPRKDIWPDIFTARLVNERLQRGGRVFDMEDEFGNVYEDVPERAVLRRRYDWMRFEGILPQTEDHAGNT